MPPIRGPILQATIPPFYIGKRAPFYLNIEIAIEIGPDRDIRKSEFTSEHEFLVGKQPIQELKMPSAALNAFPDLEQIPLLLRGPIKAPENAHQKIRLQRGFGPIHPSV
jgi:hypothetical protein